MFYETRKSRKETKSNLLGDELLDFVGEEILCGNIRITILAPRCK